MLARFSVLVGTALWVAGACLGEEGVPLGMEPAVARAARWTVALQVERVPEPPSTPRIRIPGFRMKQELVEYSTRPPGPATGMLLDSHGNVLTSHYNVSGILRSVEVLFPDGMRRPARLVAIDRSDDLALVRVIDPPGSLDVPEVRWTDPARLQVGRMVVVLGRTPEPARPTATFGIVSAVGRNGGRAFQTDAKLNYGNVGGPVATLDGEVIGLATFVNHNYPFSLLGLNSGIGFGTSAETIQAVLPRLLRGENVPPPDLPFLGVGMSDRPAPDNTGVRIGTVDPNSAAEKAGLKPNDVVLTFDGEPMEDFVDLRRQINRHRPGDDAVLKILRDTEQLELKVRLGKRE